MYQPFLTVQTQLLLFKNGLFHSTLNPSFFSSKRVVTSLSLKVWVAVTKVLNTVDLLLVCSFAILCDHYGEEAAPED